MTNTVPFPTRGQIYTLAEIVKMPLRDSPCLRIYHNGRWEYIQNASGAEAWLCEQNPIIAGSKWVFERETHEWIPVFNYSRENDFDVDQIVTIEPTKRIDNYGDPEPQMYVRFIGDHAPELTEYEEEQQAKIRANPLPRPMPVVPAADQAVQINSAYSFKEVIDSIIKPQRPSYPSEVLASDDEKAQHYLEHRVDDAVKFKAELVWDCSAEEDADKAKLFFAGTVRRYRPNHTLRPVFWGTVDFFEVNSQTRPSVHFKTEECFVAWVLVMFG
jgi:hypothetical protein